MNKVICSVLDSTVGVFSAPFTSHNEGSAIRDFGHACLDPTTSLARSPSDYTLVLVGSFNDEDGTVSTVVHRTLATAVQFTSKDE